MLIKDLIISKQRLESNIKTLLEMFENETNLNVSEVDVRIINIYDIEGNKLSNKFKIRTKLDI